MLSNLEPLVPSNSDQAMGLLFLNVISQLLSSSNDFTTMIRTLGFFRQNGVLTSIVFWRITAFLWPLSIWRGVLLSGFNGCFRIKNYRIGRLLLPRLQSSSTSKTSRNRKGSSPSCFRHQRSWSIKLDSKPSQMKQSIFPHRFWPTISYQAYGLI